MKKLLTSSTITTGLAIFSMFFGAGNLIFPPKVGLLSGSQLIWGISGFLVASFCSALLGLVTMILFNGDYYAFFHRIGKVPGNIMIFLCICIIGPLYAMPRIVALSHIMIAPFLGNMNLFLFTFIFLVATFFATYKESKIITILGNIISPLLLISLLIIIVQGMLLHTGTTTAAYSPLLLFWESIKIGYKPLDLLAALFFSSIVLTLLQKANPTYSLHQLAGIGFQAGGLAAGLLAIIYIGLSFLGAWFGQGLEHLNEGDLFSAISFRILGDYGAFIIAIAVFMACYSTIIALAAVTAEYIQRTIANNKISYFVALTLTLCCTFAVANLGLGKILMLYAPIIDIGYPALIVLTIMNMLYKVFNVQMVKLPVFITLLVSCILYLR